MKFYVVVVVATAGIVDVVVEDDVLAGAAALHHFVASFQVLSHDWFDGRLPTVARGPTVDGPPTWIPRQRRLMELWLEEGLALLECSLESVDPS